MTDFDDQQLEAAHAHSMRNRNELDRSKRAACFYCLGTFRAADVKEWADEGQTAICPKCPCDSVIGDASGFPVSREFMDAMHHRWFVGGLVPLKGRKLRAYAEALVLIAERFRDRLLAVQSDVADAKDSDDETFQQGRGMAYAEMLDILGSTLDLLEIDRREVGVSSDPFAALVGALPHGCTAMRSAAFGEDPVVVYDARGSMYSLPIFDGPPERNCLGSGGILIRFCPWCGASLTERPLSGENLGALRVSLPGSARNPRY